MPLLLICGTNMRAEMWDAFARAALDEAGYRTIAFDNRGIEPSGVTEPPYTTALMADDAIGLLEHLGIGEAFVMGASLGANIAQTVALKRPDLVRAVVLAVGGGNFSTSGRMGLELSVAAMKAGGEVRDLAWRAGLLDATLPGAQRHDDDAIAFVLEMLGDSLLHVADWNGLIGQVEANSTWAGEDHLSELEGMDAPALVIAHEFDASFSVPGRRAMVEMIPDATLTLIEGAPHAPLDPAAMEASTAAVLKFFEVHR